MPELPPDNHQAESAAPPAYEQVAVLLCPLPLPCPSGHSPLPQPPSTVCDRRQKTTPPMNGGHGKHRHESPLTDRQGRSLAPGSQPACRGILCPRWFETYSDGALSVTGPHTERRLESRCLPYNRPRHPPPTTLKVATGTPVADSISRLYGDMVLVADYEALNAKAREITELLHLAEAPADSLRLPSHLHPG